MRFRDKTHQLLQQLHSLALNSIQLKSTRNCCDNGPHNPFELNGNSGDISRRTRAYECVNAAYRTKKHYYAHSALPLAHHRSQKHRTCLQTIWLRMSDLMRIYHRRVRQQLLLRAKVAKKYLSHRRRGRRCCRQNRWQYLLGTREQHSLRRIALFECMAADVVDLLTFAHARARIVCLHCVRDSHKTHGLCVSRACNAIVINSTTHCFITPFAAETAGAAP